MADKMNIDPSTPQLPPEAIIFATKMYDAARAGQMDIFQQALPAGLPANMANERGDSLVSPSWSIIRRILGRDLTPIDYARLISRPCTAR
jgi:hypothetical protein